MSRIESLTTAGIRALRDETLAQLSATYVALSRFLTGSGSPLGVVSAPVGTEYVDTAATCGAVKWIKASGTGNTGWVVAYGDTGVRVLTASDLNANTGIITVRTAYLYRQAEMVDLSLVFNMIGTTGGSALTLPLGFRVAHDDLYSLVMQYGGTTVNDASHSKTTGDVVFEGAYTADVTYIGTMTFMAASVWPTSLPGTAL